MPAGERAPIDRNLRGLRRNVTISVISTFTCARRAGTADTVGTWCPDSETRVFRASTSPLADNRVHIISLQGATSRMSALESATALISRATA